MKSTVKIEHKKLGIRGCLLFLRGNIAIANQTLSNITLMNENGTIEKEIRMSSGPWDLTSINDSTVDASTNEGIEIINTTTNSVEKSINIGHCFGLKYYKGFLICFVLGKGILSVDLSSSIITTIDTTNYMWCHCGIYRDNIYTSTYSNTVTCYTIKGEKTWEFKDTSVINCPLAVDNSSKVYIASHINHSIVMLSPEGQRHL